MTKSATPPSRDFAKGSLVNARYRILDVVGRGGLATVYKAEDTSLGRTVALKVISGSLGDADDARRQHDEVQLIASFHHPALVTLFDFVPIDHGPAAMLVMQFVDGEDLALRLRSGAMSHQLTAEIGASIASALAAVHAGGVIHRDVKPANILLPSVNEPASAVAVLADFGIARLVDDSGITSVGTIVGTASYLSPEQAEGGTLGPATDIYSLGLVLLECLSGEQAFPGTAAESVAARLGSDPTIPADLGVGWVGLLGAMLARDAGARPSASDVELELRALTTDDSAGPAPTLVLPVQGTAATERLVPAVTAPLAPIPLAAPRETARRRTAAIAVTAAVIGVVVLVLVGLLLVQFLLPTVTGQPASPSPTPSTTQSAAVEPPAYPAVDGPLGDRLADLQASVADLESPEATSELQDRVFEISTLSAGGDYEAALAALTALQDALDDAEVTFAEGEAIHSASEDLADELQKLIDENDGPGNSDNKGKKD